MQRRGRALTETIRRAIEGGQHRVEIRADGTVVILPLGADVAHADEAALDGEIRDLIASDGNRAN